MPGDTLESVELAPSNSPRPVSAWPAQGVSTSRIGSPIFFSGRVTASAASASGTGR